MPKIEKEKSLGAVNTSDTEPQEKQGKEPITVSPEQAAANRRFLKEWSRELKAAANRRQIGCIIGPGTRGFRPIFSGDHDPDDD